MGGERAGVLAPRRQVGRRRGGSQRERVEVRRCRRRELRSCPQRREPPLVAHWLRAHAHGRLERVEYVARIGAAAERDERLGAREQRVLPVGVEDVRLVELRERPHGVLRCQARLRLGDRLRGGRRDHAIEEATHARLGQHAGELVGHATVDERLDVRNAADVVARRELLLVVGVELREREPAGHLGRQLVEDRPERAAGAAPRRPEVDQHGPLARSPDHDLVEVVGTYVDGVCGHGAGDLRRMTGKQLWAPGRGFKLGGAGVGVTLRRS